MFHTLNMFENHRKSLIQVSYIYILSGQKLALKMPKMVNFRLKVNQCYQTGQFLQDQNWWKCQI